MLEKARALKEELLYLFQKAIIGGAKMAEVEDTVKAVEDVLNDGPLVLPWLVGLKENAVKKSGKKYKEILGANIENLW